ncbi:MAG: Gluconate 2-dehydrogenase subunit 3 [Acidimicrobiales bacterium]|nr:Gluconate 2-dehydrogenase subunit 3 [Acidimicrobiales bacterium]
MTGARAAEPSEQGAVFDGPARAVIAAALDAQVPGSVALGAVDYVERLLTALDHDPPRLWAAPEGSGQAWLEVGVWERAAWAQRIAEMHAAYDRVAAGEPTEADVRLVHEHACEATFGDPAYGGNRDGAGWRQIGFPDPLFPPAR